VAGGQGRSPPPCRGRYGGGLLGGAVTRAHAHGPRVLHAFSPQIAEGCAKVMLEQLQPLVAMCLTGLSDPHPRVRPRRGAARGREGRGGGAAGSAGRAGAWARELALTRAAAARGSRSGLGLVRGSVAAVGACPVGVGAGPAAEIEAQDSQPPGSPPLPLPRPLARPVPLARSPLARPPAASGARTSTHTHIVGVHPYAGTHSSTKKHANMRASLTPPCPTPRLLRPPPPRSAGARARRWARCAPTSRLTSRWGEGRNLDP
jgi:hypothetical protein